MPKATAKSIKDAINLAFNSLTNPPTNIDTFLTNARTIFDNYAIDHSEFLFIDNYSNNQPGEARIYFAPFDCYLVLQWCYSKMEVAYLS